MGADFKRRINDFVGLKGGVEPGAGEKGAPGAEVGAVIILRRQFTLKGE